jgi:hypothetical protein
MTLKAVFVGNLFGNFDLIVVEHMEIGLNSMGFHHQNIKISVFG